MITTNTATRFVLAPRLADLVPEYRKVIEGRGWRPDTVYSYINDLQHFLDFLGADATVAELTTAAVIAFQGHYGPERAPATVAQCLSAIRNFCAYLVALGHLPADPTLPVKWPKRATPTPRALTPTELRTLWALLDTRPKYAAEWQWRRTRLAIFLFLYAGLRLAEVAGLRWNEVDLDNRSLMVLGEHGGKGGKDRIIPLHPALLLELQKVPAAERTASRAVIGHANGQPMNRKSIAHVFERWLRKEGMQITAHRLRHSFATEMLRRGADIRHIQELMGHSSLATTQRYLALDPERLRNAVDALPAGW